MLFRYAGVIAINPNTDQTEIVRSATGTVHLDENWETPIEVHDVNGFAMTTLNTTVEGLFPDFYVEDQPVVGFQTSSGHRFYLRSSTPVPGPAGPAPVSIGALGGALTFTYPDGTVISGPLLPNSEALADDEIAGLIHGGTSATGAAVDSRVAGALASNETVAQAAAEAVNTELVGRELPNLVDVTVEDDAVGGVVDATGTPNFTAWNEQGKPSARSTELLREAVQAGADIIDRPDIEHLSWGIIDRYDREVIAFKTDGTLTDYSREKLGGAAASGAAVYPTRALSLFGDSMLLEWHTELATFTGLPVWTGAHGGQTSSEIAARQGGTRALVTVPNNTIPGTGPVNLTSWTVNPVWGASLWPRQGTIGGVHGTLTFEGTDRNTGTMTFTRDEDGAAAAVLAPTEFICDEEIRNDRILVLFGYTNDSELPITRTLANIRSMIDRQDARVKRVLLMQAFPNNTTLPGTDKRANHDARDAAVREAFGAYFVPACDWVIDNADTIAATIGVTLTDQDRTDIANRIPPTSFRSDAIHLIKAVKVELAKWVAQRMLERGWIHTTNA